MNDKRAFAVLCVAGLVAEVVMIMGLTQLGASSEAQAKASVVLMSLASLGGGLLFARYR